MTSWRERLANAILPQEKRSLTASQALWGNWRSSTTATGLSVNEKSAMNVIEVLTAVRVISNGFAQVPLKVYRKNSKGEREEADSHRLYRILHDRPNEEMTSFTLRQTLMAHLLTWGNAYCEIERNFFNEPIGLWPLLPDRTHPKRINGELWYQTRIAKDPSGVDQGKTVWLPAKDVLHIPGLGFDGLKGYSVISLIRENVGLAGAYQEMASRFFSNDATPGFMLSTDAKLSDPSYIRLQEQFKEAHGGVFNKFKPFILDGGLKPLSVSLPLEDAQFIESRKFERWTILGYYGIPPHMAGDIEKSSSWGTGIAEMSAGLVRFVMDPWFVNAEQAINAKLLSANAQGPLFCEFDREGFQRGAFKDRLEGYKQLWDMGAISNAHIAKLENLPKPPAEVWLVQGALVPVNKVEEKAQKDIDKPDPQPFGAQPETPKTQEPKPDDGEGRAALIRAQRHALIDAADRILRRERADVSRNVTKLLGKPELATWLDAFYKEHRDFARKQLTPAAQTFAEAIRADVSRETGKDVPSITTFVKSVVDSVASRIATSGEADLRKQIVSGAEPTWSRAAEEVVERELTQMGNAFARAAYRAAGIPLVRWIARDLCADCQAIDGRLAPVNGLFAQKDDRGIGHPPLCEDCSCVIVAKHSTRTEDPTVTTVMTQAQPVAVTVNVPEQPAPQVTVNVPERSVTVTNNVEPTPIEVTNEVPVPSVTVDAPKVEVRNDVAVPQVNVNVEQPKRGSKIIRDNKGIITGVEPTD